MKQIFLIGDSIRMGYDAYVKESMANVARVYYPSENCRFASYVLRYAHYWKDELRIDRADAVHWNAGLWDTVRVYGDSPLISPDAYADAIERVTKRLIFLFPEASIIFATSTPVIEAEYIHEFECRYNRDVEEYNRIACQVCRQYGCAINDLYGLLKRAPDSLHSDQTHYYTAEAAKLIGGQVNRVLCEALNIDTSLLIQPDLQKYVFPESKSDKDMYVKRGRLYEIAPGI